MLLNNVNSVQYATLIVASILTFCIGCSNSDQPPLGTVTGKVTVDGRPVPGLRVLFSTPGFRSSGGFTNQDGEYQLKYIRDTMGAAVGTHSVRIDYVSQEGVTGQKQLPEKYNRKTELTREVKPGTNVINFELQSE